MFNQSLRERLLRGDYVLMEKCKRLDAEAESMS